MNQEVYLFSEIFCSSDETVNGRVVSLEVDRPHKQFKYYDRLAKLWGIGL